MCSTIWKSTLRAIPAGEENRRYDIKYNKEVKRARDESRKAEQPTTNGELTEPRAEVCWSTAEDPRQAMGVPPTRLRLSSSSDACRSDGPTVIGVKRCASIGRNKYARSGLPRAAQHTDPDYAIQCCSIAFWKALIKRL